MKRTLLVIGLMAPCALVEAHKPTSTRFTYHRDVRPIFESKCGSCHRGGGVAPMSLLSYKDAYPWAVSIKTRVLALSMPPGLADERYSTFRHASSLTAGELDTIVEWCLGGTPEGDPSDAPGPSSSRAAGPAEEPDLVLELPEPFVLGADRAKAVHEVAISPPFERERFLKAIGFRPQSANVVRSALVFVLPAGADGSTVPPIASWVPDQGTESWPLGRGARVPKGASLFLRLHYEKTWLDEGKEVSDRSRLELYFDKGQKGKPRPVESVVVVAKGGEAVESLERGYRKVVVQPLSRSIEVLALLPWLDTGVDSLLAEAVLPDGAVRPFVRFRGLSPEWPRKHWLTEPLELPEGTSIRLTAVAEEKQVLAGSQSLVLDVVLR